MSFVEVACFVFVSKPTCKWLKHLYMSIVCLKRVVFTFVMSLYNKDRTRYLAPSCAIIHFNGKQGKSCARKRRRMRGMRSNSHIRWVSLGMLVMIPNNSYPNIQIHVSFLQIPKRKNSITLEVIHSHLLIIFWSVFILR